MRIARREAFAWSPPRFRNVSGPALSKHYAASCDEIAIVHGRSDRLLQAWLVPRCTTVSPAFSATSSLSRTSVISPSRIKQKIQRPGFLHVGMRTGGRMRRGRG